MSSGYKKEFLDALLLADRVRAREIVRKAVMSGVSHSIVVEDIVVSALSDIGELCDRGQCGSQPDIHFRYYC